MRAVMAFCVVTLVLAGCAPEPLEETAVESPELNLEVRADVGQRLSRFAGTELKADLYGTCGSPGVAEGTARVIMTEDELHLVQENDILVAASTSPSWTPIFSMIQGVVVDRGASLSHAAIVGREYGIPVVMNVFEGTAKIKSGQRIKVDANMGTVYIMD